MFAKAIEITSYLAFRKAEETIFYILPCVCQDNKKNRYLVFPKVVGTIFYLVFVKDIGTTSYLVFGKTIKTTGWQII